MSDMYNVDGGKMHYCAFHYVSVFGEINLVPSTIFDLITFFLKILLLILN